MKSSIKSYCKKAVLSVIFVIAAVPTFAASMKDYVGIVSRNVSENSRSFLEQYRDSIKTKGYTSYANKIDGYLNGSFGSGFIYYGPDSKPYIITNRHVVSNAETADVKFEKDDGEYEEYKALPIVAVDDVLDIAVIKLPANFTRAGLAFRVNTLSEGDDVWSAGFPALGDRGMWQFGKGTVTNPTARIKELLDPNVSTIVQHSAEIDSGNSGGPLLVKNANYAAGYAVVGINTWKAFYRQNTNFAIPAKAVKNYVDLSLTNKNPSADINSRLIAFSKAVKSGEPNYRDIARFISNDMISMASGDAFIEVLKKAPTDIRSEIVYIFIEDPLEGLKCSIAYNIWKNLNADDVVDFSAASPEKTENGNKVSFTSGEETIDSLWIMSQGAWRLKEFGSYKEEVKSSEKASAKKTSSSSSSNNTAKPSKNNNKLEISNPYLLQVLGGPALSTNGNDVGFDLGFLYTTNDYVSMGVFVHNEPIRIKYNYSSAKVYKPATSIGFDLRIGIPLNFNFIIIEPKADVKAGIVLSKSESNQSISDTDLFYFGIGGGLDITVAFSRSVALVIGAEYLYSFYLNEGIGDINISAGIKFLER